MTDFTTADLVALLRAAEFAATTGDEIPLASALSTLDHEEALQAVAILCVVVQAAHAAGTKHATWNGFLGDLSR